MIYAEHMYNSYVILLLLVYSAIIFLSKYLFILHAVVHNQFTHTSGNVYEEDIKRSKGANE